MTFLASTLQFLITISSMVSVVTGPLGLLLLAVAAVSPRLRRTFAQRVMVLLMPVRVYLWVAGLAACLGACGWWTLALVVVAPFWPGIRWAGIVAAMWIGQTELAVFLAVASVFLLLMNFAAAWLDRHDPRHSEQRYLQNHLHDGAAPSHADPALRAPWRTADPATIWAER